MSQPKQPYSRITNMNMLKGHGASGSVVSEYHCVVCTNGGIDEKHC